MGKREGLPEIEKGDLFEEVSAPPIDFRQVFLYGMARSWLWIALLSGLFGTIGVLSAASKPNTYTSEAKLLLRLGEREALNPSEMLLGTGHRESRPTMEDEIHILNDVESYRHVAQELGPAYILEPTDPRRYDTEETPLLVRWMHRLQWRLLSGASNVPSENDEHLLSIATRALQLSTVIFPESRSNIIVVRHTSTSPEKAHAFLQAIVKTCVDRHRQQFSILKRLEEHRGTVDEAQNSRDEAKRARDEHVQLCGFIDMETQLPALLSELSGLDLDLFAANVEREAVQNELHASRLRVDKTPRELITIVPAVRAVNDEWQAKNTQRNALLLDLDRLDLSTLPIQEVDRQRNVLREQISKVENELLTLPREIIVTPEEREGLPNPDWLSLDNRIAELVVQDENLGKKVEKLQARLRDKQVEFDNIQACQTIHEELDTLISENEDRYGRLKERFVTLETLGQIDLMEESDNLKIVAQPTYTEQKDGPNRKKSLVLGFGGGLLLGIMVAVLREIFDPRLRYPEAVERALGVRLLGVVPETPGLSELAAPRA